MSNAKSPSKCRWTIGTRLLIIAMLGLFAPSAFSADPVALPAAVTVETITAAFAAASQGFSSDELLVRDDLRTAFLNEITEQTGLAIDDDLQRDALLTLLRLRKTGKLNVPATRRGSRLNEDVFPIAEIASRVVMDRHRVTSDTLLADPRYRRELVTEAQKIAADVDPYSVRKAVLSLRKRRQLKPELVLKVADWPREVQSMRLEDLHRRLAAGEIPKNPGIYLFRERTGYLYIGEASDLAHRLTQHLSQSDRESLASYLASDRAGGVTVELHIFPPDSPAAKTAMRRAYESELIRSRTPKFNVRP